MVGSMKINSNCNPMSCARNFDPSPCSIINQTCSSKQGSSKRLMAKGWFAPWTMEDGIFSWYDLMVQLSWFVFLENQFTKSLGFSRGVNWMWTKSNDHARKNERVVFFFYICSKRVVIKNYSLTILLFSLVFIFSSLKIWINFYYNNISLSWALCLSIRTHLWPLPPQNLLDHVSE